MIRDLQKLKLRMRINYFQILGNQVLGFNNSADVSRA